MDKPKAVTAAAHKRARLIYRMLTRGEEYTDQGQDYYEDRYRERAPPIGQARRKTRHETGRLRTTGLKPFFAISHLLCVS
jgi:hypothetical protein